MVNLSVSQSVSLINKWIDDCQLCCWTGIYESHYEGNISRLGSHSACDCESIIACWETSHVSRVEFIVASDFTEDAVSRAICYCTKIKSGTSSHFASVSGSADRGINREGIHSELCLWILSSVPVIGWVCLGSCCDTLWIRARIQELDVRLSDFRHCSGPLSEGCLDSIRLLTWNYRPTWLKSTSVRQYSCAISHIKKLRVLRIKIMRS